MIEHLVLFKFKEDVKEEELELLYQKFFQLKSDISAISDLSIGRNFSDRSKGFNVGLVVRFESKDDLMAYQKHPKHMELVDRDIKPRITDILAVDYHF